MGWLQQAQACGSPDGQVAAMGSRSLAPAEPGPGQAAVPPAPFFLSGEASLACKVPPGAVGAATPPAMYPSSAVSLAA